MIEPKVLITGTTVTVSIKGRLSTIHKENSQYEPILDAIRNKDWDSLPDLIDLSKQVEDYGKGNFKVKGGTVYVDDQPISGLIADRLLEFMKNDLPHESLVNFVRRLRNNPSFRAIQRLYACLEKNHHPLMSDGRFLAYKKVREDFTDCHTGKFGNKPGTVVEMPRSEVDDNDKVTCSTGLHVASWDYAANSFWGGQGHLMEVAVDPADVVSVPFDYGDQKMRVCKYEIIQESEEGKELKEQYVDRDVSDIEGDYWDGEYYDDDDEEEDDVWY